MPQLTMVMGATHIGGMSVGSEAQRTGGESGPGDAGPSGEASVRPEEKAEEPEDLSDSEIFDILRNGRRRAVISLLREHGELSVPTLTRHVAAEEYGVDMEDLSPDQHKRVYTGLYQCHLPRLDDAGVVSFDKDRKTVRLEDNSTQVERYLDHGDDTRTARAEIVGALLVAAIVTLGMVGVGPLAQVPPVAWAIATVVALLGFAGYQLYAAR